MTQPSYFFKTIGEALNKKGFAKVPEEAYIALEFENETKKPFQIPAIPGFTFHTEHSLRHHGFEYVFEKPLPIDQVRGKVEEFLTTIKVHAGLRNPLTCSARTSTHVHWDITKLTYMQALNWAICYWLVEDLLSEFCGADRQGNHFCLRMKDALLTQSSLAQAIRTCKPWGSSSFGEEMRYGSLNLNAWKKFGSMEFRMLQGIDEPEKLMNWIFTLENTRKFSLQFKNPGEIYKYFIDQTTAEMFPKKVFGEYWPMIFKSLPQVYDVGTSVRSAFMELTPLFLSGGDWLFEKQLKEEDGRRKQGIVDEAVLTNSSSSFQWATVSLNAYTTPQTVFNNTVIYSGELPSYMLEDFIPLLEGDEVLIDTLPTMDI